MQEVRKTEASLTWEQLELPKKCSAYDVLASITKYEVEDTLEDFCSSYGYNEDSRKAERIYQAVKDEWLNVQRLFSDDELELLREIQ